MKQIFFAATLALSSVAIAQPVSAPQGVSLKSGAFVVKQVPDANGKMKNVLQPVTRVVPGDVLVFVLEYRNNDTKPAAKFVINNPLSSNVSFTGTEERWASVSVDGGKSFGPLATLKVAKADGTMRPAIPADVTAIRWILAQPIPPAGTGKVQYYGVVK